MHSSLDTEGQADFSFPVTISNTTHNVNVRMRPFLLEFLEVVSTLYEVVIFTASQRVYAEQLLNIIDEHKRLIRYDMAGGTLLTTTLPLQAPSLPRFVCVRGRQLPQGPDSTRT